MSGGGDRIVIAVAVLASFVAFLDGSVVNLALPAVGAEFGGGLPLQQWVVDGYLLALGSLILVAGSVSDSVGRLRVLRAGLAVFGAASLLCAVAWTGPVLVAARFLQGVGAAFLVPGSLAMLNERFAGPAQARSIGIWTAWTGTAFVVGPVLGGLLVDALSWRWIFVVNLPPLAVTLYLTRRLPTDWSAGRAARIDVVGATLTAIGLAGTVFALIEGQRLGFTHPIVVAALTAGLACLVAFPWWEHRATSPMVPLAMFTSRNFAVGNAATVFLYAAVSLGMLIVPLFLQETVGLSATQAGLATLPIPVVSFLLAARFGALAGWYGPRLFMTVGPLVGALGCVLMSTVRTDFEFGSQMLPGLVLFGLGLTVTVSPLTSAVLAAVDPAQSGIGSAINNAISRVAGLIAVAFASVAIGGTMDFPGFRQGVLITALLFAGAGAVAVGIRNEPADLAAVPAVVSAGCRDRAAPPPAR